MDKNKIVGMGKFISMVLRHKPETIDLELDDEGWASVKDLIDNSNTYQKSEGYEPLTKEILDEIVAKNDKKRFEYSEDGWRIRARQGHSVDIDINIEAVDPPEYLYHGTATRFIPQIKTNGLSRMKRNHVHLSGDIFTAVKVGKRHGKPFVIRVKSKQMHEDGFDFFHTDNNVWLVDEVPVKYLEFEQNEN